MKNEIKRDVLKDYLFDLLAVSKFKDYCPNGLQVEGSETVRKVVAGVTASQALLDEALRLGADTVLVHHGYFWKGEAPQVTGIRRKRLKTLLSNDLNLFAYHLPLDAHPLFGNNAQWAKSLGWQPSGQFGDQDLGCLGELVKPATLESLLEACQQGLRKTPLWIGEPQQTVHKIAWCSGGGDGYFESAIAQGVDVFLTGEISEPAVHLARESGVAFVACGHHATERFGVQALAHHLADYFGIDTTFVDIDSPA